MNSTISHLGEFFALSTAIVWAFAVILFKKSGETVHPLALNLFKNLLALILILPTMWLWGESIFLKIPSRDYLILILSGALGIGIADTLFFKSLNLLGAGMTAIVDCLYSPFIIIASMFFLSESLTPFQFVGVLIIISAVLTASNTKGRGKLSRHNLVWGIFWGVLSMANMAVGVVLFKPLLNHLPLLWVTEIRLFGGILVVVLILLLNPSRRKIMSSINSVHSWFYTISGSLTGAYLSMILWLAGMKLTQASNAAAPVSYTHLTLPTN